MEAGLPATEESGNVLALNWQSLAHRMFLQREGVRVFLQVYKELELAIQLGSEYAQNLLEHPNIVVSFRPMCCIYLCVHLVVVH